MRNTVHGIGTTGEILNIIFNAMKNLNKSNLMLKGKIEHARIFGDFFGEGDVTELENAL